MDRVVRVAAAKVVRTTGHPYAIDAHGALVRLDPCQCLFIHKMHRLLQLLRCRSADCSVAAFKVFSLTLFMRRLMILFLLLKRELFSQTLKAKPTLVQSVVRALSLSHGNAW